MYDALLLLNQGQILSSLKNKLPSKLHNVAEFVSAELWRISLESIAKIFVTIGICS
jgi:hypothetical protein